MRAHRLAFAVALVLAVWGCDALITNPSLYGSLRVEVTQRDGAPFANVPVWLYRGTRRMGYGTTNSDGVYVFEYVPTTQYGVFVQKVAGYADIIPGLTTGYVDGIDVLPGSTSTARIELLTVGTGTITGTVKDAAGAPVPSATVVVYRETGPEQWGVTDATGQFAFPQAPFGNLGVYALSTGSPPGSAVAAFGYHDGILVDAGSVQDASVTIAPCAGTITAFVLDDAGNPVPGALVRAYNWLTSLDSATTDANGAHRFQNVVCGGLGVEVKSTPAGWSIVPGRFSAYVDGLTMEMGDSLTATMHVKRSP